MTAAGPAAALRPVTPAGILAAGWPRSCGDRTALEPAVRAELTELADLAGGLEPYLERNTTAESAALAELARGTREHDWAGADRHGLGLEAEMLSGHVEGQLLQLLVACTGAARVLEVGMFSGYSALAMAEVLPAHGRLIACELDPAVAAFARQAFDASPAGPRIEVRVGPAATTLHELADAGESFDLIFIDADKAGYRGYVETILAARLLGPRGVLCIDNTLMQGQPWTGAARRTGTRSSSSTTGFARVPARVRPAARCGTASRWPGGRTRRDRHRPRSGRCRPRPAPPRRAERRRGARASAHAGPPRCDRGS